jgi:ABC-type dipeptide/oligopeptide/nickel transport system permease subunit
MADPTLLRVEQPSIVDSPEAVNRSGRVTVNSAIGLTGFVIALALVLMAVFATQLSPFDPTERVARPFLEPSVTHPLGTNDIGQDLLSELIHGARISLTIGIVAALVSLLIGTAVGVLAGFYPRRLGRVLMRGVDLLLVLPFLPLLIVFAAYLGRSLLTTVLVIGFLSWAGAARVIRAHVLSLTERDYVLAARSMGATDAHIMIRHVLPRVMLLAIGVFVQATSGAILLEASLSFLGLGDPVQKSWGTMLYWAQVRGAFLTPAWLWWVLPPGLLIATASLAFALMGFALEQRINPRLKNGR